MVGAIHNAEGTVYLNTKYTDKNAFAPKDLVTSCMYDFTIACFAY